MCKANEIINLYGSVYIEVSQRILTTPKLYVYHYLGNIIYNRLCRKIVENLNVQKLNDDITTHLECAK